MGIQLDVHTLLEASQRISVPFSSGTCSLTSTVYRSICVEKETKRPCDSMSKRLSKTFIRQACGLIEYRWVPGDLGENRPCSISAKFRYVLIQLVDFLATRDWKPGASLNLSGCSTILCPVYLQTNRLVARLWSANSHLFDERSSDGHD